MGLDLLLVAVVLAVDRDAALGAQPRDRGLQALAAAHAGEMVGVERGAEIGEMPMPQTQQMLRGDLPGLELQDV